MTAREKSLAGARPESHWLSVLLTLQVVLLRTRLLVTRSLLRGLIALRSFIRRRRQRTAAVVQIAHIRVYPRVSVLISRPTGRLLPVFIIGAVCALSGFMTGWQYERDNWTHSRTADAVSKNSAVKPGDDAKLAIKGENPNASTTPTQTKSAAPHVVLLNPGTADNQASAQTHTPQSPRPADNEVSRPLSTHKKANDASSSTARRPPQSYQDLRDYVLRR
jgi:hypothetical protein